MNGRYQCEVWIDGVCAQSTVVNAASYRQAFATASATLRGYAAFAKGDPKSVLVKVSRLR